MATRASLQQGSALKTQNGSQEDNRWDLKKHCKRAMSSADQMWIFLSWLLHFWKCCITVSMLRPNTPFCSTTFQNLSDIIYSQGREGRWWQLIASVKLLSDSLENRGSPSLKKNQLTCKCTDNYKFRNDYSGRCFYICGDVKLQAQPYCSL